ncbi:MAG: hypothetical protein ACKVIK_01730 [Rhodospirillales bacterium]
MGVPDCAEGLMDPPRRFGEFTFELFTGNIFRMGGTLLGMTNKGDTLIQTVRGLGVSLGE